MQALINYLGFKDCNTFFKEILVDKDNIFLIRFIILWFECDFKTWEFNLTLSVDVKENLWKEILEKREIWSFIFAFIESVWECVEEFSGFQAAG